MLIYTWESDNQRTYAASCQPSQSVLLFFSGIWGSFYAILLQRVIKDGGKMKEIKDNGDEKKLLGIHPFSVYRTLYDNPSYSRILIGSCL